MSDYIETPVDIVELSFNAALGLIPLSKIREAKERARMERIERLAQRIQEHNFMKPTFPRRKQKSLVRKELFRDSGKLKLYNPRKLSENDWSAGVNRAMDASLRSVANMGSNARASGVGRAVELIMNSYRRIAPKPTPIEMPTDVGWFENINVTSGTKQNQISCPYIHPPPFVYCCCCNAGNATAISFPHGNDGGHMQTGPAYNLAFSQINKSNHLQVQPMKSGRSPGGKNIKPAAGPGCKVTKKMESMVTQKIETVTTNALNQQPIRSNNGDVDETAISISDDMPQIAHVSKRCEGMQSYNILAENTPNLEKFEMNFCINIFDSRH